MLIRCTSIILWIFIYNLQVIHIICTTYLTNPRLFNEMDELGVKKLEGELKGGYKDSKDRRSATQASLVSCRCI
jgi:hypothetical protein